MPLRRLLLLVPLALVSLPGCSGDDADGGGGQGPGTTTGTSGGGGQGTGGDGAGGGSAGAGPGGHFRHGVNYGYVPGISDDESALLARRAGANSARLSLPERHLEQWGYDIEVADN